MRHCKILVKCKFKLKYLEAMIRARPHVINWFASALALLLMSVSSPATLLPDARNVSLPVQLSEGSISVKIPAGAASCVVEVRPVNNQRWYRWSTLLPSGKPALSTLSIPKSLQGASWRATATVSDAKAALFSKTHRFPDSFYQGLTRFSRTPAAGHASGYIASVPVTSLGRTASITQVVDRLVATPVPMVTSSSTTASAGNAPVQSTPQPEEADIWKIQGRTVYFFNQLRGLQVIDLSNPSTPQMTASLRLPAVGQDLYVLPSSDAESTQVVLLTRSLEETNNFTDVVLVRIMGSVAEVVSKSQVAGWLADSRMTGNRLYVLTSSWAQNTSNSTLNEITFQKDGTQQSGASFNLENASGGLISAGAGWLSVASNARDDWSRSNVTLFSLSETGAKQLTPSPIACSGRVYDKFKVSLQNEVLTIVSQRFSATQDGWRWEPVTLVENYDSLGNPLSKPLEVIRGEELYATRFLPGKLYLVTAVQTDPLWVIDLSDRFAPAIAGHVEVPGFSTYIEPVGDDGRFLFTIGLEAGKVAASLFDVSEVSKPELKSRVYVSESGTGFSEAVYDEKALKVLPEDGLVLVPFSGWRPSPQDSNTSSFVRLVDLNLQNGGSLNLRGRLNHAFAPRRATLLDGYLASISQKELITADITDRDHPALLAQVGLAWPVNQVLRKDQFILQVGDGSNAGWTGETAALRITKSDALDAPLADIDLGEGTVQDATIKGSRLYVLRKKWGSPSEPLPYHILGSAVIPRKASPSELILDVYDASSLPSLSLLGSASSSADASTVTSKIGSLTWISDTIVAVISQPQIWSFGWEPPILMWPGALYAMRTALADSSATGMTFAGASLQSMPVARSERPQPAVVRAFDVTNATSPVALKPITLPSTHSTMLTATAGGDGLLVYGYGEGPSLWKNQKWPQNREQPVSCVHKLGLVDFATPNSPVVRASVILPGRLFAVSEVSRTGFLVFTESLSAANSTETPSRQAQVSSVDYPAVTLIVSKKLKLEASIAAEGRSLFVTDDTGAQRSQLNDLGQWVESQAFPLPFQPNEIAVKDQDLLGISGDQIQKVSWKESSPGVQSWKARIWVPALRLLPGEGQSLYAPQGDYGVQFYRPEPSAAP